MCTEVLECSRRGNIYLSPLYNQTGGTQAHCLLCPASKDCFGIRKLQPCGVWGGMGEVGIGLVKSEQFWERGVRFLKEGRQEGMALSHA